MPTLSTRPQVAVLCERDPERAAALLDNDTPGAPRTSATSPGTTSGGSASAMTARTSITAPTMRLAQSRCTPRPGRSSPPLATAGTCAYGIRALSSRVGHARGPHRDAIHGLAFSPDGANVIAAAGCRPDRVRVWVLPVDILDTARKAMTALPWLVPTVGPFLKPPTIVPRGHHPPAEASTSVEAARTAFASAPMGVRLSPADATAPKVATV